MSSAALDEAKSRLGRVLNEKWTLEELIGVGGMAAVYRARHRNDARAAVKILHPALARHPQVRERFLREGYAANHVQHRGAVQVQDDDIVKGGEDDGTAYLVMELLEGESLEQRAARPPPITEQEFLTIANGVLSVLEAAHSHGVVHRDLKPENIFLARDPEDRHLRVKVLDFGLACLTDAERTTGLGLALGTPSYMSPEQASGRSAEIDGRTDLFALGATGFRLLASRKIHEEADPVRLVGRMANEPAPPLRSVAPAVSEEVAAIIDRALAFRREDRYPDAAAMRADVQAARDVVMPSSTRILAASPMDGAPSTERDLDPTSDDAPVSSSKPRRSFIPYLAIALFASIGLVAYAKSRRDANPEATPARTAAPSAVASVEPDAEAALPPLAATASEEPVATDQGEIETAAPPPPAPHPPMTKRAPHPPAKKPPARPPPKKSR